MKSPAPALPLQPGQPAKPCAQSVRALLTRLAVLVFFSLLATPRVGLAQEGCSAFTWNVTRELAAMVKDPAPVEITATNPPPRVELDRHYLLRLAPQDTIRLAARPGKPMLDDGARAGLLTFRAPTAGRYRVSITTGHWLDVVDGASLIPSRDFQGQRGCDLVHKIVEFELPAGRDLILQLSGGTSTEVGLAVTAVANAA